jgi:hypothetical protein
MKPCVANELVESASCFADGNCNAKNLCKSLRIICVLAHKLEAKVLLGLPALKNVNMNQYPIMYQIEVSQSALNNGAFESNRGV